MPDWGVGRGGWGGWGDGKFPRSRYPAKWICTWGSITLHYSVLYPGWGMEPGGAGGRGKREVVVVVVAGWGGGGCGG